MRIVFALFCLVPLLPALAPTRATSADPVESIVIGGSTAPDGKTEVACDLPVSQRTRNVGGSDGSGLCVFSSIGHSARFQHERTLEDFQKFMRSYPGGGYPEKVEKMINRIAEEKHLPRPRVVQYEGRDPAILDLAIHTGRMPGVTYDGHDPHYGNHSIAHMVNLVYLDQTQACVLDNNFIGANELVWMTRAEFLTRWQGGSGGGWCVVLLQAPPPPPPCN